MTRCASVLIGLAALWVLGQSPADEPAGAAKDIDLVVCLDTSNSMDGLIDAAKQKLWDLVNTMAKAKPTPNLRVGLYSYGNDGYDPKAGWVRKELDFTTDLDMVFKKLFDLKTRGGTEYVARVCRDAIQDLKWSARPDALKLIFVCGNEPASQDPTIKLPDLAQLALQKGVVINPIYCGGADDPDARDWRELALLAKGKFANIDQAQKVAITTPFDKKLADLADKVNETYIPLGRAGDARLRVQQEQTENSKKLGTSNLAGRVVTQSTNFYARAAEGWDLVDKLKKDKNLDVTKLPESELPEKMRKMSPAEKVRYVQELTKKREAIQKEVEDLARQRQDYLREEMKRNASQAQRRFDAVLQETIREQAEKKGIAIPK